MHTPQYASCMVLNRSRPSSLGIHSPQRTHTRRAHSTGTQDMLMLMLHKACADEKAGGPRKAERLGAHKHMQKQQRECTPPALPPWRGQKNSHSSAPKAVQPIGHQRRKNSRRTHNTTANAGRRTDACEENPLRWVQGWVRVRDATASSTPVRKWVQHTQKQLAGKQGRPLRKVGPEKGNVYSTTHAPATCQRPPGPANPRGRPAAQPASCTTCDTHTSTRTRSCTHGH
jgi:hypothetical protein